MHNMIKIHLHTFTAILTTLGPAIFAHAKNHGKPQVKVLVVLVAHGSSMTEKP